MGVTYLSELAARVATPPAMAQGATGEALRLREIYNPRKPLLTATLAAAVLMMALAWAAPRGALFAWAALVVAIAAARTVLVRRFNADSPLQQRSPAFWRRAYIAGAGASGVAWGASAFLFPAAGTSAQVYALLIAGLTMGTLNAHSVAPRVFAAFLLPATLPYGWRLATDAQGGFDALMAALFAAWLAAAFGLALYRGRAIAENIGRIDAETERLMRGAIERDATRRESEARARVVAQLSHELRTPLNAIVGFSEAIKQGVFGPIGNPRYRAYAENIHDSGRHLLGVIERALSDRALEPAEAGQPETDVDLNAVAAEAAAMFETRARQRRIALVRTVEEPVPFIRGNADKLRQALINLVSNAVKFTPDGGRVVIEVATRPGEGVVMRVSDTGMGMDAGEIAEALNPVRAAAPRSAAGPAPLDNARGVGLLTAKWLIEQHGGSLSLRSTRYAGTVATLRLPGERLLLRVRAPESRSTLRLAAE